ncbi:MAG: DUF3990 domain-containing protein [Spirochaetaceae bacterium]|jgi:hypothetical protein|nr:DUF3990 domain-containing protein [Spirochaetaceae bacterium]
MTLYHGSNTEIDKIDLGKCRPLKDFGRGFYTTPLREQAWAMAKRTVRIYGEGPPCITEFMFDDAVLIDTRFNIKRFEKPNLEWAKFVVNNRNHVFTDFPSSECNTDGKYDIVTGPVANDDITALINVYLAGILSDDALIKELTFRELSGQVSFHSERAAACLQKKEAYHA